jgi:ATP-dependent RNA helicase DeaD
MLAGGLDAYRVVVESLAEEFDVMDIAAAAVKQADVREKGADDAEIPTVAPPSAGPPPRRPGERPRGGPKGKRVVTGPPRNASRARITPDWEVTRLYIGAGRRAGVRPGDLVGAIANEVGVDARAIGAIQIADSHSIVEVPDEIADEIVAALRATTIQGKRVPVRRDRDR